MIIDIVKFNAIFFGVFSVLWLIGYGAAKTFSPRTLQPFATLLAPVWGAALIMVVLTPISLIGVPLKYVNWLVYAIALILTMFSFQTKGISITKDAYWRHGIKIIAVTLVLSAVGGSVVLFSSRGMSFDTIRGSTDFMAYWATSDYLNHFGGRLDDYLRQDSFRHIEIYGALTYLERWGTMVFLGFFSSIVSSEKIYILINPLILVGKASLVLLLAAIAQRSKYSAYPVVIILSLTAITYSNLYFTYFSFSIALPIAILASWCTWLYLKGIEISRVPTLIGIGLLLGISLVGHSIALVSLCFTLSLLITVAVVPNWRRIPALFISNWKNIGLVAVFFLPYVYLYGVRVLSFIFSASTGSKFGWVWERLPNAQDLAGFGNTLGFNQLDPVFPIYIQLALATFSLIAIIKGARKLESGIVIFAFVAFVLVSLPKFFYEYYVSHNPLASHSIAKLIFSFSDLYVFLLIIGVLEIAHSFQMPHFRKIIFGTWAAIGFCFLFFTTSLPIFYGSELVELIRNETRDATFFVSIPDFGSFDKRYIFGPILRNNEKVIAGVRQLKDSALCRKPVLVAWHGNEALHGEVLSTKGAYSLGYPPNALNFTQSPENISLVSGFNYWEGTYRWLEKNTVMFLKPTDHSNPVENYRLRISAIGMLDQLRSVHKELGTQMKIDLTINGTFNTSFELKNGENEIFVDVPVSAVAACDSFMLIEFNAPYEVSGADFGTSDTKKMSWGMRQIELMAVSSPVRISRGDASIFGADVIIERGNCSFDESNGKPTDTSTVKVIGKDNVDFVGWAADVPTGAVPKRLFVELDGQEIYKVDAFRGMQRQDVAAALNKPELVMAGWESRASLATLTHGAYRVGVVQIEGRKAWHCDTRRTIKIE